MGCIVITSGCAILEPWAAMLGGMVGGVFLLPSSLFFLHVCKIDDPVDAVTVRRLSYLQFSSPSLIEIRSLVEQQSFVWSPSICCCCLLSVVNRQTCRCLFVGETFPCVQVHGTGGALGVLWYALMAKKELVAQLYGELFQFMTALPQHLPTAPRHRSLSKSTSLSGAVRFIASRRWAGRACKHDVFSTFRC